MLLRRSLPILSRSFRCFANEAEAQKLVVLTPSNIEMLKRTPLDAVRSARERVKRINSDYLLKKQDIPTIKPTVKEAFDTYNHPFLVEGAEAKLWPFAEQLLSPSQLQNELGEMLSRYPHVTLEDRIEMVAFLLLVKKEEWFKEDRAYKTFKDVITDAYNNAVKILPELPARPPIQPELLNAVQVVQPELNMSDEELKENIRKTPIDHEAIEAEANEYIKKIMNMPQDPPSKSWFY